MDWMFSELYMTFKVCDISVLPSPGSLSLSFPFLLSSQSSGLPCNFQQVSWTCPGRLQWLQKGLLRRGPLEAEAESADKDELTRRFSSSRMRARESDGLRVEISREARKAPTMCSQESGSASRRMSANCASVMLMSDAARSCRLRVRVSICGESGDDMSYFTE